MDEFSVRRSCCGWQPDLPDHRDYSLDHAVVVQLLDSARSRRMSKTPQSIDWRDFCPPVRDQGILPTATAHACLGLIETMQRRALGLVFDGSPLFVYQNASRLLDYPLGCPVSLRAALKAIVRCGLPPEATWPHGGERFLEKPPAIAYCFPEAVRRLVYVRLGVSERRGNVDHIKSWIAAGFVVAFGFMVTDAVGIEPSIPLPAHGQPVLGGHAVVAIGYDDRRRIGSARGAILFRNSWGTDWGDAGYGWLPYEYFVRGWARDCWTALVDEWFESSEIKLPVP